MQFNQLLSRNERAKSEHKSSSSWLNRASELLDLSSGDSREQQQQQQQQEQELFGQQQQQQQGQQQGGQQGQQGFIPQIVMNPWDPNQAPVMTLAPLANAMQAYHQQMLSNIQQQQQQGGQQQQVGPPASVLAMAAAQVQQEEEEEQQPKCKVLCVSPDDELGFLMNLPPPCNVMLQPSTIGMSGKVPQSKFLDSFEKFLKGAII